LVFGDNEVGDLIPERFSIRLDGQEFEVAGVLNQAELKGIDPCAIG
jgi:hypothetical protein